MRIAPVAAVVVLDILRANAILFLDVCATREAAAVMLSHTANALVHGRVNKNVERVAAALQDTLRGPSACCGSPRPGAFFDHLGRECHQAIAVDSSCGGDAFKPAAPEGALV